MDAIEYLTGQHREIESLFDDFESAARPEAKLWLWRKLADLLAVHRALEEKILFPVARNAGMEELLLKAVQEHRSTEPVIADLVERDEVDDEMTAMMSFLRERESRHADDEEMYLFPRARELLAQDRLEMLGRLMAAVADDLMGPGVGERLISRVALA